MAWAGRDLSPEAQHVLGGFIAEVLIKEVEIGGEWPMIPKVAHSATVLGLDLDHIIDLDLTVYIVNIMLDIEILSKAVAFVVKLADP